MGTGGDGTVGVARRQNNRRSATGGNIALGSVGDVDDGAIVLHLRSGHSDAVDGDAAGFVEADTSRPGHGADCIHLNIERLIGAEAADTATGVQAQRGGDDLDRGGGGRFRNRRARHNADIAGAAVKQSDGRTGAGGIANTAAADRR